MQKKTKIIIGLVGVGIVGMIGFCILNNQKQSQPIQKDNTRVEYDQEKQEYSLYDENNTLVVTTKQESELQIYRDNPDYLPNPH